MRKILIGIAAVAAVPSLTGLSAQSSPSMAVPGYGRIFPEPDAAHHPDPALRYRVVFNITKASPEPGKVNPSLEKVARFLNLLAHDGVRPAPGDIVAIVHGPATSLVLNSDAYREKFNVDNPNLSLIEALGATGAEVHVCSQALHGQSIPRDAVAKQVVVDLAALTTLTKLQLQGFALMPD